MAKTNQRGYSGYYKEHYCRSLGEFHVALYLDIFDNGTRAFKMEPIKMTGKSGKGKIPDLISEDKVGVKTIWEIKYTKEECDEVEQLYRDEFPELFELNDYGIKLKFVNSSEYTKQVKNLFKYFGKEVLYDTLLQDYKLQDTKIVGFPGELNPSYGKPKSYSTKRKIAAKVAARGGQAGSNNANYGNKHTIEAKIDIGAKWHEVNSKNSILRNSLLNRLGILDNDQYNEFVKYCIKSLSEIECKMPRFMNGIIKITNKRVIEVFGSYENFWNFVRLENY